MTSRVDVLACSPHPDDAEIGCAGFLLLAAREGLSTVIVDFSEGENASRGDPATRRLEKEQASLRLGLEAREGLNLPDCRIGRYPEHEEVVIDCLRRWRPRLVLAPYVDDRHPDHEETARLIKRAVFLANVGKVGAGSPHRAERTLHYMLHRPFTPSVVLDISTVMRERREVLESYRSQFFPSGMTEPQTMLSDGDFLNVLEARARFYGAMINAAYGEPFFSDAPLSATSPRTLLGPVCTTPRYGSF